MQDADYGRLVTGERARDALALIALETENEGRAIDQEAVTAIRHNSLTPELAVALWHKKAALHTLERRLTQKANQGVSSAKRIAREEASNG